MEEEKRRISPTALAVILLFVAALLFFSAIFVLLIQSSSPVPDWQDVVGLDANADDMPIALKTRLFGLKLNDKGQLSYSVLKQADVDAKTGECTLEIKNPPENRYLMEVEITLADSDEVVYKSGLLKPNQQLEKITLEKIPELGKHEAVIYFHAVDFDTLKRSGSLQQDITLNVK